MTEQTEAAQAHHFQAPRAVGVCLCSMRWPNKWAVPLAVGSERLCEGGRRRARATCPPFAKPSITATGTPAHLARDGLTGNCAMSQGGEGEEGRMLPPERKGRLRRSPQERQSNFNVEALGPDLDAQHSKPRRRKGQRGRKEINQRIAKALRDERGGTYRGRHGQFRSMKRVKFEAVTSTGRKVTVGSKGGYCSLMSERASNPMTETHSGGCRNRSKTGPIPTLKGRSTLWDGR